MADEVVFNDPILGPIRGSGRSSYTGLGVTFDGEAFIGFGEGDCSLIPASESCGGVCVLKMSNPNQGFVSDCGNSSRPLSNMFQHKLCCTPSEVCNDGIDNTGDGLVDCASPDCHPSPNNFDVPQRCDPHGFLPFNNQLSDDCASVDGDGNVVYAPHCLSGGDAFYCSYGRNDENVEGFCCPSGKAAIQNTDTGVWFCDEPTQCGVGTLPSWNCDVDHRINFGSWFGRVFSSVSEQWCHSHLPNFYNPVPVIPTTDSSAACCFRVQHAIGGFFYHADNVKIYGAN